MFKWFRRDKAKAEQSEIEPVSPAVPEAIPAEEGAPVPPPPSPEEAEELAELVTQPFEEHPAIQETAEDAAEEVAEEIAKKSDEISEEVSVEFTAPQDDNSAFRIPHSAIPVDSAFLPPPSSLIPSSAPAEEKKGFFARLRDRLGKTKASLVEKVRSVIRLHGKVDEELLEEIEMILIQSDVCVATTRKIVDRMRLEARRRDAQGAEALIGLFKEALEDILRANARNLDTDSNHPTIILVVGVNGTGKTTTNGKIAKQLADQGKSVIMAAADTFRAAAIEQLTIWAERTGSAIVRQEQGADPAAVVYEALEEARRDPPDVILIDTAGRLHTKINLMEELRKVVRVIKKHYPEAPHETILVLDATTGQNAVNQVKMFHDACALTGLIMTKLDGTAKGGILIACKDLYDLPILKIGIGEGAEDLRDFDPHLFIEALFSNGNGENGAE